MIGNRRWLVWAAVAYAVIIVAVAVGLGRLYNGASRRLDEALGQRLLAVAGTLAEMTDAEAILSATFGDTTSEYYLETLLENYTTLAERNHLAEITLTNPVDEVVILTTSGSLVAGQTNDFWSLDPGAVETASLGSAAVTRLYELGGRDGLKQKSAYAPIVKYTADGSYVVAVVTVSGNPGFFDTLAELKRAALFTGLLVLLVLVLMGVFLSRISVALTGYRASLLRRENLVTMGRLTKGIAHEIRNPLGIIRGAGEHLQRVLADHGIDDEVAGFIPEEVDRLNHILTGYLDFGSDNEAGDEIFEVELVLRRTVELVGDEMGQTGVAVAMDPLPAVINVVGDARRWQQVCLNLLLNARDAMPDGGVVRVVVVDSERRVRVKFIDEGVGLPKSGHDRIFEPFWTSKEKGSGLGLAMSRQIMDDMGGGLTLRNRDSGPGVEAELWLPVICAEGEADGQNSGC